MSAATRAPNACAQLYQWGEPLRAYLTTLTIRIEDIASRVIQLIARSEEHDRRITAVEQVRPEVAALQAQVSRLEQTLRDTQEFPLMRAALIKLYDRIGFHAGRFIFYAWHIERTDLQGRVAHQVFPRAYQNPRLNLRQLANEALQAQLTTDPTLRINDERWTTILAQYPDGPIEF